MTEAVPWLNRKFTFDFPANLYPNIIARVRGTPPRLEDAVRGLSREQLIVKHSGKWSIQENAGHLLDAEDMHWRRLQEYQAGAESLTPAPYENIELKHNTQQIGTILSDFRAARERQVELLTSFRPDDFARTAWHARLTVAMRLVDYLFFIAEHDDHHLVRVWELRRA
jgi:uncharacterized damage-inducible protein DinB